MSQLLSIDTQIPFIWLALIFIWTIADRLDVGEEKKGRN